MEPQILRKLFSAHAAPPSESVRPNSSGSALNALSARCLPRPNIHRLSIFFPYEDTYLPRLPRRSSPHGSFPRRGSGKVEEEGKEVGHHGQRNQWLHRHFNDWNGI